MLIIWHAVRGAATLRASRAARGLASLVAAILLVALATGTAAAQDGPTKLFDPTVSARNVRSGTAITFAVMYRNREGSDPAYVRVSVAGAARSLARTGSGGTIHDGLRYAGTFVLPAGTWPVTFEASDTRRFVTTLAAGSVTVTAATPSPTPNPTPRPTPQPTPKPTPRPTSNPTPPPTPKPTPERPSSTTPPAAPSPSRPPAGPSIPGPSGTPGTVPPVVTPSLVPPVAPSSEPSPTADPQTAVAGPISNPSEGGGGPTGPTGGWTLASAWLPAVLGGSEPTPLQRVLATAVTTGAGVTVAMSFALFGKRRRDSEPTAPDDVLEASAASSGAPAAGSLVPGTVPAAVDGELALPRWRRPSLLEARKADPSRSAPTHYSLTFSQGLVDPVAGLERRRIRYRVVRLLDGPDELLASEIGFLDEGDEVQLVERTGSFWKVLCPDGRSGWLHRMVLGEIIGAPSAADDEIDDDVLAAFRASRAEAS